MVLRALCLALLVLAAAGTSAMERRVYAGREAQAIECSYLVAMSAVRLERQGVLSTSVMEQALAIGALVLAQHVTGTDEQKIAAFRAMARRSDPKVIEQDYRRYVDFCRRTFPIAF